MGFVLSTDCIIHCGEIQILVCCGFFLVVGESKGPCTVRHGSFVRFTGT